MTKNVSYWKGKFISNKFNSVIYFFYLLGIIFFHKPEKLKSWDPMFLLDRAPLEPGRLAPPLKINVNQTMSFSVMSILTHIRQLVKVDCPKRRGGIILQSHYFSHALSPRFWIAMAAQKNCLRKALWSHKKARISLTWSQRETCQCWHVESWHRRWQDPSSKSLLQGAGSPSKSPDHSFHPSPHIP